MEHDELRTRAEQSLRMTRRDIRALSTVDVQEMIHELQVHQIELQMQNEALRIAQLESEQAQTQYRDLFECAPVGYVNLDARGTIARVNTAGRAILGSPPLGAATLLLRAFVASSDRPVFDELLKSAARQERCSGEVRLLTKQDSSCHVRMDMSVVPGRPMERLVVLTDVSERKRSVDALERLNLELEARVVARTALLETQNERLAAELEARSKLEAQHSELEARVRASERLESLGLLAAGLAHDFNNLLVSVLGNAELLLRRSELTESAREPVLMIKRAGRLASELTRQLLIFAGRGQLNRTAVDLPKLVTENLALMRTRMSLGIGIELDVRIPPTLPEIEADRGQVSQIVLNLITNAVEALDEFAGHVVVAMRAVTLDRDELATFQLSQYASPGEFVVLEVRDTGCGMDAVTQQRVFDPFFSTKFTGRGLGLASVAGIVQAHRGAVRVYSALGEGTRIEVAFRVAERKVSERPPALVADWKGSGPILLIDDDDTVRKVMAELLTMLGFEVTAAGSGEAGLELYHRRSSPRFKFVVLDWIMPGMSGAAVLEQLRKSEPELPVLLISGYSVEDLANYDPHSICLQKPMMFEALRDAVRSMLVVEATVD